MWIAAGNKGTVEEVKKKCNKLCVHRSIMKGSAGRQDPAKLSPG